MRMTGLHAVYCL